MPNSLRAMIKKLRYQGKIDGAECEALLTKLKNHDEKLTEKAYMRGYNDGIIVSDWIPCSEKMPSEAGYYLVTAISYRTNKPEVFISFFETNVYEDGKWICQWCNNNADKHLAWMPLPDPYKGESEEEVIK